MHNKLTGKLDEIVLEKHKNSIDSIQKYKCGKLEVTNNEAKGPYSWLPAD